MSGVKLEKLVKRFDKTQVIHGVDLDIAPGEFCVFVGPSGCGKSTLLRMIAGLEEASEGSIRIGKRDVTHIDAAERGIAMVFQTYALYPHMSVAENIGFGLRMAGTEKNVIKQKVLEAAQKLKLEPYLDRKPKALSGGQRQRVAIGRALVRGPEVFLFDEPLSNLDAELRVEMRVEIARLHSEIGATMVYVTHDQVEAMTLADKIVILRLGKIEQIGAPMELYNNPDNKFVAGFIGSPAMNFLTGTAKSGTLSLDALGGVKLKLPKKFSGDVIVGIRPEHLKPDIKGKDKSKNKGLTVKLVENLGGVSYIYATDKTGQTLTIEAKGRAGQKQLAEGNQIGVKFSPGDLFFFDAKTEQRIR